jgi:hypothetical protein
MRLSADASLYLLTLCLLVERDGFGDGFGNRFPNKPAGALDGWLQGFLNEALHTFFPSI